MPRAHLEPRKGTIDQAVDYCKKKGTSKNSESSHCRKARRARRIKKDGTKRWRRRRRKIRRYTIWYSLAISFLDQKKREDCIEKPKVLNELDNEWRYGPTGTGKSRTAHEDYPDAYIKANTKWWDGYIDQEVVIIDDFWQVSCATWIRVKDLAGSLPIPGGTQGRVSNDTPKKDHCDVELHPTKRYGRTRKH